MLGKIKCWLGIHEWIYSNMTNYMSKKTGSGSSRYSERKCIVCSRKEGLQAIKIYFNGDEEGIWKRIE